MRLERSSFGKMVRGVVAALGVVPVADSYAGRTPDALERHVSRSEGSGMSASESGGDIRAMLKEEFHLQSILRRYREEYDTIASYEDAEKKLHFFFGNAPSDQKAWSKLLSTPDPHPDSDDAKLIQEAAEHLKEIQIEMSRIETRRPKYGASTIAEYLHAHIPLLENMRKLARKITSFFETYDEIVIKRAMIHNDRKRLQGQSRMRQFIEGIIKEEERKEMQPQEPRENTPNEKNEQHREDKGTGNPPPTLRA